MLPKIHFLFGTFFAIILFLIFPQIKLIGFLLIIFSSVLIDIDHYFYYVFKKRDLSLKKAYNYFIKLQKEITSLPKEKRNKIYKGFFIFHGFEIIILFLLLSLICKYFLYVSIGIAFHLILDIIHQKKVYNRKERLSVINDFLKFKKVKEICLEEKRKSLKKKKKK